LLLCTERNLNKLLNFTNKKHGINKIRQFTTVCFSQDKLEITSDKLVHDLIRVSGHMWLGGVVVGHQISDQEVVSLIPGCSAARCNSGQVVHTRVPLFTKLYKLVPASAGGKVHHSSGVRYAGSHSADFTVGGHAAPLQHRSYLWLPLYSGLEVTSVTYAAI